MTPPNKNLEACGTCEGEGFVIRMPGPGVIISGRPVPCPDCHGHPASNTDHDWRFHASTTLMFCSKCGIVQRKDGKNKPCPGKRGISLRDEPDAPASKSNLEAGIGCDRCAKGEWKEQIATMIEEGFDAKEIIKAIEHIESCAFERGRDYQDAKVSRLIESEGRAAFAAGE